MEHRNLCNQERETTQECAHNIETIRGDNTNGFDNRGFRSEARDKQWQSNEIPLDTLTTHNMNQQHAGPGDASRRTRNNVEDSRREMAHNIRHITLQDQHYTRSPKQSSIYKCLTAGILILLVATIIPIGYIYYQFEKLKSRSCSPVVHKDAPSTKKEPQVLEGSLRSLKDKVANLTDELKRYMRSSSTNKCPARNTREDRRRYNMLSARAKKVARTLNRTENDLKGEINNLDMKINKVKNSMEQLQAQISRINQTTPRNIGKCVFKLQSSSTENTGVNSTVTIIQSKAQDRVFIGVSCCTDNSQRNQTNTGLFSAIATKMNITYRCHCRDQPSCQVCYWDCG